MSPFLELVGWRRSADSATFGHSPFAIKLAVVAVAVVVIAVLSLVI